MNHTLVANQSLEFIRAFAPRRNRSQRRHCRKLHWAAVARDLAGIRAEVEGKKWVGAF